MLGSVLVLLAAAGATWHLRHGNPASGPPPTVRAARVTNAAGNVVPPDAAHLVVLEAAGAAPPNAASIADDPVLAIPSPRLRQALAAGAQIRRVRVNAAALLALAAGDRFALPLPPDGPGVRGVITQRLQHPNGDVSLVARADGDSAPVVMTVGHHQTYITAAGYEVTAVDGVGEAVPAASLGPPDPSVADYRPAPRLRPPPVAPRILP